MSSSLIEPLLGGGLNTKTLRKVLQFAISCKSDQLVCDESAAFFNESIICDIIRGMNPKPPIGHLNKRHEVDVGLTRELRWSW